MNPSKARMEMQALLQIALEDLTATSDRDLRAELVADGLNPDVFAVSIRTSLQEAVAAELRERLVQSRQCLVRERAASRASNFPAIAQLKAMVQRAFEAEPSLGLAFREGKRQSDADWQSLYEDLIELGAIVPDGENE